LKEENIKMKKENKEQLEEVNDVPEEIVEKQEDVSENVKEPEVSELKEEPCEEPKEEPKEEIKEEPKEEPKEDSPDIEEEEKPKEEEKLKKEIESTKEELAVIKEVRDELVNLYADYKEAEQSREQLFGENNNLKEENMFLKEQLVKYKDAEEKLRATEKVERLEKLSAKFNALGQEKTVEYLQHKDEEILLEFEKIVDAALDRVGEIKEMPSVTRPSQGEFLSKKSEKLSEEDKKVKVIAPSKAEQLSNPDFFKKICSQLTNEQVGASSGKRVRLM